MEFENVGVMGEEEGVWVLIKYIQIFVIRGTNALKYFMERE